MNYVVGFMFSPDLARVALIRKAKPEWQRGKLNGVGGKLDLGELPKAAMVREFREEAGAETDFKAWLHFATMSGREAGGDRCEFSVECFAATGDLSALQSMEAEQVEIVAVADLNLAREDLLDNVAWLVGLARDYLQDGRPDFTRVNYA